MDEKKVQAVIDRMVSGMERCNCDLTDGFKPLRLIQNPFLCFFSDNVLQRSGRYAYKLNPIASSSNSNASRSSKDTKAPASRLLLEQIVTPDPIIIISPPPAPKKLAGSIASTAPGSSKKSGSLHQFYSDDENDCTERIEETCTDDIQTFTQKATTTEKIKVVPVANRLKKANGNALELRKPEKKRDRGDETAAASNKMDVVDQVGMIINFMTCQLINQA